MKKRYKRTFLVLYAFCSLLVGGVSAQSLVLSLEKTISLAADSSLEAFRTKNLFLSGYWEFRNYKAERLPSLTLNITPAEYYRDITKRYDSEKDIDEYRKQQSFYAGGNLKIKQNFDMLGGSFFVDTDLGYMRYFGSNTYNQFTSVPIRIGYSQDLLGYNPFRWEKKIEPLKYEKVKKDENMKAYFNEAHFLMENMTKRNQTVLIVANALVNIQSGYFLYDDELYPCTLSQLASETGFHESTISRTLNNKYYSFNGEAYPLKKLLVSQTASGDSSDSIKKAIVELVDDEDKEHPLSDNQILKKLEELELHCSRRVIVKYRQQLNIPSSTKRKVLKKVG